MFVVRTYRDGRCDEQMSRFLSMAGAREFANLLYIWRLWDVYSAPDEATWARMKDALVAQEYKKTKAHFATELAGYVVCVAEERAYTSLEDARAEMLAKFDECEHVPPSKRRRRDARRPHTYPSSATTLRGTGTTSMLLEGLGAD